MTDLARIIRFRAEATDLLRTALKARGFLEVEVPTMVASPGMEPHLRAFRVSAAEAHEVDGRFLHTSPEYAIKATLAAVEADVFTFARAYRDEPPSRWHHPEFTMVEWYRRNADYTSLMDDCEAFVNALTAHFGVEGLGGSFDRVTVEGAFDAWVGVSPDSSAGELRGALAKHGVDAGDWDWDALFTLAYAELVEPQIARERPCFLLEFPARMAALARLKPGDARVAERFELYLPHADGAIEAANAFSELVDELEQRRRFTDEVNQRASAGLDVYPLPEPMLAGLTALGPTAGIALGFERLLVWLAANCTDPFETRVSDWLLGEPTLA